MMAKKIALITGVTGQDGSYLAEYLLKQDYVVHGIKRRSSLFNTSRIDHLYEESSSINKDFVLHYGDMTDGINLTRIIKDVQPDEIYNLAAMSHVKVSFELPEYTANVNALGPLRILEAVRLLGMANKIRIYQASTAELYGLELDVPQKENTPFYPRSPFAVAKLYAYWIMVNYREAYGMHISNGILFNHESPVRGENFVTRKITRALSRIALGLQDCVYMGNLSAMRDWGYARDYVKAMHAIVQQDNPGDFVIATGNTTSVRDFIKLASFEIGLSIAFEGNGDNEAGYIKDVDEKRFLQNVGKKFLASIREKILRSTAIIRVDSRYYRPTEVNFLLGDSNKAKLFLGWDPEYEITDLVKIMMLSDIKYFEQIAKKSIRLLPGYEKF